MATTGFVSVSGRLEPDALAGNIAANAHRRVGELVALTGDWLENLERPLTQVQKIDLMANALRLMDGFEGDVALTVTDAIEGADRRGADTSVTGRIDEVGRGAIRELIAMTKALNEVLRFVSQDESDYPRDVATEDIVQPLVEASKIRLLGEDTDIGDDWLFDGDWVEIYADASRFEADLLAAIAAHPSDRFAMAIDRARAKAVAVREQGRIDPEATS